MSDRIARSQDKKVHLNSTEEDMSKVDIHINTKNDKHSSNSQTMENITASIITIGDELLIGQVTDTNSSWIAEELIKLGIWIRRRVVIGDVQKEISNALDQEAANSDLILITGGLGPTTNDITKPLLTEYFNGKLVKNEQALENIKHFFENVLKRPMEEANLKQAEVPDNCTPLQNESGTAPGMWFEKDNKVFICMPGGPSETKAMFSDTVLPKLKDRFTLQYISQRTLVVAGVYDEAALAAKIKSFEEKLPVHITLASLPRYGMVRLRLTAKGKEKDVIDKEMEEMVGGLKPLVKDDLAAEEDITMETVLGRLLEERKKTVATAESCTGGHIAHLMTANPDSSSYFTGSVVCYDKKIKETVLKVDKKVIDEQGTVCKEVAIQLVKGVIDALKSDYAIGVTGLMGPDAGGEDKPVGTVWIAVGDKDKVEAEEFFFKFDRKRNVKMTSIAAMNKLRMFILNQK